MVDEKYSRRPHEPCSRFVIVRLRAEGWNKKGTADFLEVNRDTVHATLKRWTGEGVAILANKSTTPRPNVHETTDQAILMVNDLQENLDKCRIGFGSV